VRRRYVQLDRDSSRRLAGTMGREFEQSLKAPITIQAATDLTRLSTVWLTIIGITYDFLFKKTTH